MRGATCDVIRRVSVARHATLFLGDVFVPGGGDECLCTRRRRCGGGDEERWGWEWKVAKMSEEGSREREREVRESRIRIMPVCTVRRARQKGRSVCACMDVDYII